MSINDLEAAIGFEIPLIIPIILILYMVAMLLIGLWAAKKVKNAEDWFVGGREMGPWITALAHGSSSVGGGMYIAAPQFGWEGGASSLWAAPGDVFGPLLNFGIIARRMRRYTERTKSLTIPDFFGHRYYSRGVKLLSVIILLVAMVISLIVEYLAMGLLLACITGWSFEVSLVVSCGVILIYTGAGGYLAVAYTDFIQSLLMIVGLAILIPVALASVGGFTGMNAGLYAINPGLPTMWGEDFMLKGAPLMIAGTALVYFVGYMGQPHLVIKTVAIKDEKSIRLVPLIGGIFGFFLSFGLYMLGMVGRVAYPDMSMLPGGSAEYVLPMLALTKLPPVLAGLLLACACSAIMSTASALLLVVGSSAGSDLYHGFINKNASEGQVMKVTKLATYILGVVSVVLCFLPIFQVGIYQVTWVAWSILSPAFIPLIVGGLYWKRGTKEGAYASLIVGSVVGFGWYYLLQEKTQIHTFFAALVLAIAAYIIVSLMTKKPPQDVDDLVDYAKKFEDTDTTDNRTVNIGIQMSREQFEAVVGAQPTMA
ncbi:MAG: sodium/proline symporter [Lawsonibacter sp.]|jgi:sodium/proline symporter|nr:sodium/proline symporter [Lawsonibacter sp.]